MAQNEKKPVASLTTPSSSSSSSTKTVKQTAKVIKKLKPTASPTMEGVAATQEIKSTLEFYLDDLPKTLFPLETSRFLVENGENEIKEYIKKCLDDSEKAYGFAPQKRVYASKPGGYLRRTVKLDPVAEYYLYDVIFQNRALFRKPHIGTRAHYGYRFEKRCSIPATQAYKGFKGGLSEYGKQYAHTRGMDVATYFNSLYHHDIVNWFHELGASDEDAEGLGQLLREIASGRSIDCLPQGLYPSKMIGNDFLRFIDSHHELKSSQYIRFMDDMYIFSDNEQHIESDFQTIQRLLGDRGLSLNSRKTRVNDVEQASIDTEIDKVKQQLLKRRRFFITVGYDEEGTEIVKQELIKSPLSAAEMDYINSILDKQDIEEDDAELILTIMRGHAAKIEKRLPYIIRTYPHLAKNVHSVFFDIDDKEVVADMIFSHLSTQDRIPEIQMFWFSATLSEQLMGTSKASSLISLLMSHRSSTHVSKARVLEIADKRFGLQDVRNEFLTNGQSDWLGWASAVGSRVLKPASRNHVLKYWAKGSNLNHLITTILAKS